MADAPPVLVALPLDQETPDIVETATEVARRLRAPTVVVHAIPHRRMESDRNLVERITEARSELEAHLSPLREAAVVIRDVTIVVGDPAEEIVATAHRLAAQMIVTGGGRSATVRRWVVGSVAEAILRRSSVPVWVARGVPPAGRPLLCAVDLSPESKVCLAGAIRMARLFKLPLRVMTVVCDGSSREELDEAEGAARKQLLSLVAEHDVDGLDVSVAVSFGNPAQRIVEAARGAGLMVIAGHCEPLMREWLGPVAARTLRDSHCSTLAIRHIPEGHDERMQAVVRLADLFQPAKALVTGGQSDKAIVMLESLAEEAPTNAAIQETFAIALEHVGRDVEASSRHALAKLIRERLTPIP